MGIYGSRTSRATKKRARAKKTGTRAGAEKAPKKTKALKPAAKKKRARRPAAPSKSAGKKPARRPPAPPKPAAKKRARRPPASPKPAAKKKRARRPAAPSKSAGKKPARRPQAPPKPAAKKPARRPPAPPKSAAKKRARRPPASPKPAAKKKRARRLAAKKRARRPAAPPKPAAKKKRARRPATPPKPLPKPPPRRRRRPSVSQAAAARAKTRASAAKKRAAAAAERRVIARELAEEERAIEDLGPLTRGKKKRTKVRQEVAARRQRVKELREKLAPPGAPLPERAAPEGVYRKKKFLKLFRFAKDTNQLPGGRLKFRVNSRENVGEQIKVPIGRLLEPPTVAEILYKVDDGVQRRMSRRYVIWSASVAISTFGSGSHAYEKRLLLSDDPDAQFFEAQAYPHTGIFASYAGVHHALEGILEDLVAETHTLVYVHFVVVRNVNRKAKP